MRGELEWHNTERAAREANGRGERDLALRLLAQSVEEARDPNLDWHELQSALAGAAMFHEYITENYPLALEFYRESQQILNQHIGANAREAISFGQCISDCEGKADEDGA